MATLAELLEIIKKWKLDIDTDGKKGPQLRKEIISSGYTITGKTATKTKKPITKAEAKKVKVVLKKAKGRGSKVIKGKVVDTVAPAPAPPSIKLPPKIPVKPPVIKLPPKAPVKKPVIKLPVIKAPVKKPVIVIPKKK